MTTLVDRQSDALLIVDLQPDFMPGGALAVPGGDEVVAPTNAVLARFDHAVATQDWHPPGHASFASAHPGKRPFETVSSRDGDQTFWPDHCVQGTEGAALHPGLDQRRVQLVIRKGFRPTIDSYSGFRENDRRTPTGLAGYLRECQVRRVFVTGLARDYCVHFTALDALAAGFEVVVLEDCCRAIDAAGAEAARSALLRHGGASMNAGDLS